MANAVMLQQLGCHRSPLVTFELNLQILSQIGELLARVLFEPTQHERPLPTIFGRVSPNRFHGNVDRRCELVDVFGIHSRHLVGNGSNRRQTTVGIVATGYWPQRDAPV